MASVTMLNFLDNTGIVDNSYELTQHVFVALVVRWLTLFICYLS